MFSPLWLALLRKLGYAKNHTLQRTTRPPRNAGRRCQVELLEDRTAPAAMIWTDQPDYAPGSSATIHGTGFHAGETAMLDVLNITSGLQHAPWFVTDGDSTPAHLDGN